MHDGLSLAGALVLALGTFLGMEGVAFLLHKYVMHGPLWVLHASHHRPRRGLFEANDLFGVFFAVPSTVLIVAGAQGSWPLLAVGAGMTAYGVAYFGFHDVVVHRRVRHRYVPRSAYMQRIIRTHLVHHRTTTKQGATAFGFLYASGKTAPRSAPAEADSDREPARPG